MAAVLLLELPSESRKAAAERSGAAFCCFGSVNFKMRGALA
jgi:hypothetical protein